MTVVLGKSGTAYANGYDAAVQSKPRKAPVELNSILSAAWLRGYDAGSKDTVAKARYKLSLGTSGN